MGQDVCRYVASNVYVNGIKLGYIIPELEQYMADHYDAHASNIISMFALDELAMLEAYKEQFIEAVNQAWDDYVARTQVTVQMEMDLNRQVIEDTINYLWDRSAYPGQSLDDVYPRPDVVMPEVSFAAKNSKSSSNSGYYTGAAIATLAISSAAAYNLGRVSSKAAPETLL